MRAIFIFCLFGLCSLAVSKTLNLDELPSVITVYNQQGKKRITSLEDLNRPNSQIAEALSANQYMKMYHLTRKDFIKRVFGNTYHLPIEKLSSAVSEWNKQQTEGHSKITSIAKFNTECNHIHGVFSSDVYQTLYDINQVEFTKRVFGDQDYFLSLENLPQAIEEYNKNAPENARIYSYGAYTHFHTQIEGTLSLKTYRTLYNMKNTNELIKFLFKNISHLTLEELPPAIEAYHHKVNLSKITSLSSFGRYRNNILGALSFELYEILYETTKEDFEDMLAKASGVKILTPIEIEHYKDNQNSNQNPESKTPPLNLNTSLLTLEQTPQAIIEYNIREVKENNNIPMQMIHSWNDYNQYYTRIPGADSIENLEKQYKEKNNTLTGFMTFLLSKPESTLTPIELSRAIAQYNSAVDKAEQIIDVEDYEVIYYRILHAPTLEVFKQFANEKWNNLFREKFGTIDNYIESILIKNSCELALAS